MGINITVIIPNVHSYSPFPANIMQIDSFHGPPFSNSLALAIPYSPGRGVDEFDCGFHSWYFQLYEPMGEWMVIS